MAGALGSLLRLGAALLLVAACAGPASPAASPTIGPTTGPTQGATASTTPPTGTPALTAVPTASPGVPSTGVWARLAVAGESPPAREAHTWTVDPATGSAYLFGGRDGVTTYSDLWRFDPRSERWARLEPGGTVPPGRFGHDAVWLPGRGLVVFAGQSAAGFFNDLWLYDPVAATWSLLPAGGDPPVPRYGSCAVLGSDGRLWISHGFTEDGVRFADTRAYDFAAGAWVDQTPAVGDLPVARCLHACFEADDGRFILFGGQTTGTAALGDLWALSAFTEADSWAEIGGTLPPPRNLYASVRTDSAFVVFGGGSLEGGFRDDTWTFSGFDLSAAPLSTTGEPPAARRAAAFAEDVAGGRLLLFGGWDGTAYDDLWILTLS